MEERIVEMYGATISAFEDGSVWIHRGSRNKRRFGNTTDKGYKSVLIRDNGVERTVFVHRIIATAFIPNPENKPQVNHKNGIKTDNRPSNLEWCTNQENCLHKVNILKHHGRRTPVVCVESGEVFDSILEAATQKNTSRANIHECLRGNRKTAGGYTWERIRG